MSCSSCWQGLVDLAGASSPTSSSNDASGVSLGAPEHFEEQFVADFEHHLQKRNRFRQVALGAIGATGGGCIGLATSHLFVPGIGIAALVGGAAGYHSGEIYDNGELQKHPPNHTSPENIPMPTIRCLKYFTKWGHQQLVNHMEAPDEWRSSVIDAVVKAFFPLVQQMHSFRHTKISNEVLECLMPLYLFLQRRVVREALLSAARTTSIAFGDGGRDNVLLDRCHFVFPIVLETLTAVERLDSKTFEQLRVATSRGHDRGFFSSCQVSPRREQEHITETLRAVLERQDVREALQQELFASPLPRQSCSRRSSSKSLDGAAIDSTSDADEFMSICSGSDQEWMAKEKEDEAVPDDRSTAASSSSEKPDLLSSPTSCEERMALFPKSEGIHTWRASSEDRFKVRSETYLQDRVKAPSGTAMFKAVHVEIITVGPAGPVWRVGKHRDLFPSFQRRNGDKRFFVIFNWVFPPYQSILIGALDPSTTWQDNPNCPQARLWDRFLEMEPEQQRDLLKVIISIDEGPFFVKKVTPKKPVLIGRRVKTNMHHEPGDHLEFVMDIATSKTDQYLVSVVMQALKGLQVSISTLLEARHDDELPETLMFCGAVEYMDLSKCGYPIPDPEWQPMVR